MSLFTAETINGLVLGAAYGLFAVGLTIVFGVNRIMNLAHGAVFTWGAIVGYELVVWAHLPFVLALVIAMVAAGGICVLIDVVAFRPIRTTSEFPIIVAGLGAGLILQNLAQRATNTQVKQFPFGTIPLHVFGILGASVSSQQLAILVASVALTAAVLATLRYTRLGVMARAAAENRDMVGLFGVNRSTMRLLVFWSSGAMAGAAGVLIGVGSNSVQFLMGEPYLLVGVVIIVVAGMGNPAGAWVVGLLLGVLQSLTIGYVSSSLSEVLPFVVLIVILLIKPTGLFGGYGLERRVMRS
jgi:branched-chain amino acid transport system permease protein